jgi:hypothetical protein
VIATPTATFLPPPTVTPFPTVTPRGPASMTGTPGMAGMGTPNPPAPTPPNSATSGTATLATLGPATNAPTVSAPGAPPVPAELGRVLFMADFSQGWPSIDEETAKVAISGGKYVFEVGPFDGRFMSTTTVDEGDLYAQVEVIPQECSQGGGYGLLFRFADEGNYYLFNVYCNNTFTIIARVNGRLAPSPLAHGPLPEEVNASSTTTHTVGVLTVGDEFTLLLDGVTITSVRDTRHVSGDVALYAVSEGENIFKVAFDNLEVWAVR